MITERVSTFTGEGPSPQRCAVGAGGHAVVAFERGGESERVRVTDLMGHRGDGRVQFMLDTPIRGSHGDRAALAISFDWIADGKPAHTRAISVITADDQGLISRLQAYWAPDDHELLHDTTTD